MINNNYYSAPKKNLWTGRIDATKNSTFFQLVKLLNLNDLKNKNTSENKDKNKETNSKKIRKFAVLGFECDEGVKRNFGRVGAKEGPQSFREIFSKFPVHSQNFELYDAGNIVCEDQDLEAAQSALAQAIYLLLSNNFTPIVIGGGHEIAWGHYQGIRKFIQNQNLGIVNFDAHLDMRHLLPDSKGSSGTPFLQIALDSNKKNVKFDYHCVGVQHTGNSQQLFETAQNYNVNITFAEEIHQNNIQNCQNIYNQQINRNDHIYLTLCLDVFSSAHAPGVSAVQPLGLSPWHIIPMYRKLIQSNKIISFDIAELCPKYDQNYTTAKLAASFVYEILHFS